MVRLCESPAFTGRIVAVSVFCTMAETLQQRRAPLRLPGLGGAIQAESSVQGSQVAFFAASSDRHRAFCAILERWIARVNARRSLPSCAAASARVLQGHMAVAEVEGDDVIAMR
jgi:hypothetical protein